MPGSIETITEPSRFGEIFQNYFARSEVFLKTSNGNFKINYTGVENGIIALQIPLIKKMPQQCVIFCRVPSETVYSQLYYLDKVKDEVYTFKPMKVQIISAARNEERNSVSGNSKQLLFVTRVISDSIIDRTMALEPRRCELIRQTILNEMEQMFPYKKLFLINEGLSDLRMRYFYDRKPPYIVKNINDKNGFDDPAKYYFDNIYQKDYYLNNRKQFLSEAACPILYNRMLPIGYIQVNHQIPIESNVLDIIQTLSQQASKLLQNNGIFELLEENLLVSDLSAKGVGIVFKQRSYIRYFPEKSYVHFELKLPDQVRIAMLSIVRNITFLENKIIKVGCEIIAMDASARQVYDHFLESIKS